MIVAGALVPSVRQSVERPAVSAPTAVAEPEANDPLAMLENFVESAAQARKAFAEDRLKFLQEQMTKLSLFNLVPGALADHSARMAKELESAAGDFAGAVRTLGESRTATDGVATPPESYLDVIDAGPAGPVTLSDADRETAATFVNVALHLRLVVDLAENDRGFDADRESERARERTDRVVDMMNRLDGGATSSAWW
jgi:hypothetical protein